MVGSLWYYSFCISKLQSNAQCRLILSTDAMCAWKSSKKIPQTYQKDKSCALNDEKFSQGNKVKEFGENFLSSKPAEFYLRGISKLLGKFQNNGEYSIDWS